ncbi:MAG: terminase large subunit [Bauldia sp.]|nr:terminase large subunit [Bauldia sp.]
MWDTSCPDWADRLLAGRSLVPNLPLFRSEADKALRVFNRLRIPDLIGKPTMGEKAGPWLRPIVEAIFGSYDPAANVRMIQEFFWLIPKKNTKTSSAAAIMVEALILNRRPEAEYALIAPTKEVADISFKQAAGTIRADPALDTLFQIQQHIRTITHRRNGGALQVKAADTDVVTGGKQVGTLVDELHVLASKRDAADILLEIRGALTARPDGFLIIITTQSKQPPVGVFKTELNKARDVRDGLIQLPLLPILYELPLAVSKDGGWKDRRLWPAVNPNLGRSVSEDFLVRELAAAERAGAAQLALFASQHFNVEIGLALRTDRWSGADFWETAADVEVVGSLEALLDASEVAVVGIDGGGLDDLLGFYVIGREKVTRRWLGWGHAWAHQIVLDTRLDLVTRLRDFEAAGTLTVVPNDSNDDIVAVADFIEHIRDVGLLPTEDAIGVDPVGVSDIVDELTSEERGFAASAEGIAGQIVGIRQGYTLTTILKVVAKRVAAKTFVHGAQEIMAWAVGNARIEQRGNAIIVTKQASGTAKIDPLMALFNAAELMNRNPEAAGLSVFDQIAGDGVVEEPQGEEIDMEILRDPKHPRFYEMRDRWERKHLSDDEVPF